MQGGIGAPEGGVEAPEPRKGERTTKISGVYTTFLVQIHYQSATRPIEPKSKAAVLTPKALNALTMVEKVMLLPLSIFDI